MSTSVATVAAPEPSARGGARLHAMWPALVCLSFVVLCLLQSPGEIVGDTKLDLVVDPLDFLARALSLWEAQGYAGQLQYQAYGYFFPMGPFFSLGDLVGLPMWVVQRLWLAALMCTAFLGVVLLARRLRIGTPTTALVAGIAYAMSPRMLSVLSGTSVEVTPMALAPWVIVPLAGLSRHGSVRRAAALSGLAVFCAGGVNAVATAAVLPLAVLFLGTRPAGPLRRRLVGWWVLCVGLATLWWAAPLLLLGRYSPTVMDYVETAAVTTAPTDVLSVLRGTTYWIASLASPSSGPYAPAGWSLLRDALPVAATLVLAVAGLVALTRRRLPERTWLVLGLLTGVALVTMGHLATVDGAWAGPLHEALDRELAPLRNVHKFDPVLRLPLALGMAHLVAVLARTTRRRRHPGSRVGVVRAKRFGAGAVLVAVVLALVGTASPALAGRLTPPTGFAQIPDHWQETADFLAAQQPAGRALLVPGSSFGSYQWGRPADEPLQSLAESPWEVRSAIPLTPGAHIRMLDAIEQHFSRGEGSAGLARYLARAGISHLVLRNDLDVVETRSTRSSLVRQSLRGSPGITRVATFGDEYPQVDLPSGTVLDAGLSEPAPAIEIYTVADPAPPAWTAPLSSAVTVHGGPEAVLALEDRGLVTGRPVLLAGESSVDTGSTMVSDALLRRERAFGRLTDATSGGLTADAPLSQEQPAEDYAFPGKAEAQSVVDYVGATPTASSSGSDLVVFAGNRPDAQPWAAVDSDMFSAWRPAAVPDRSRPDWWRLTTDQPFVASEVTISIGRDFGGQRPAQLRLTTDAGTRVVRVRNTGAPQVFPLPRGSSRTLTISETTTGADAPTMVLHDVVVPGVEVDRTVVTPAPSSAADVYAFDAVAGRPGCLTVAGGSVRCAGELMTGSEEPAALDRVFTTDVAADYELTVTAVPRPGPALGSLLATTQGDMRASTRSIAVSDPRGGAAAAVDGDPRTAWLARPGAKRPTLVLTWPEPREMDTLRVVSDAGVGSLRPDTVTVDSGDRSTTVRLAEDGTARFEPVVTDRLELTFASEEQGKESFDPYTQWTRPLGIGVNEVEVGGPNVTVSAASPVVLPCGEGPTLSMDDRLMATRVVTTLGALQSLRSVPVTICDGGAVAGLTAGQHRLTATGTAALAVESATLVRTDGAASTSPVPRDPVSVSSWGAERRTVEVEARDEDTLLVVPENTNAGWTADLDGRRLESVAVDGWQQGYVLPAGPAGTVDIEFAPGATYRAGLIGGAGAVVLLAALAVLPVPAGRGRPGRHRPGGGCRPGSGRVRAAVLTSAALGGMAFVGGAVGAGAVVLLWTVTAPLRRRRHLALALMAAGTSVTAGVLLLMAPDGTGTVRQVLAIVALGAVVTGIVPVPAWLPRRRAAEPVTV
ncbi:alpha-(1-_3)-arabinofuranosyltransferase domain-containing protein [Blastococcus goldschmidtiae]|uniref:Alpha-(1->3)-arabinofuranosyltransferase family protein n=1 Tax=Blastococcus goldschmidtiae TaxID=3075546 RepID=A0ABU2K7V2_9ACTN|nr:alpha-(1->3)-arabinofuranosyltransferase family protein [Blastococcus sp. DSM 46792]MDT0276279.1 alpha-(1->3)-arabinofuranosyltransferase family protein [Blastococcus sp. DSM 46792]